MEPVSKWMLCMAVVAATGVALLDLRVVRPLRSRRERGRKRGTRPVLPNGRDRHEANPSELVVQDRVGTKRR